MPTFTGTSIIGIQLLGTYVQQTAAPYVSLDFPGSTFTNFKVRTGLLLVVNYVGANGQRVIDYRKVFLGAGILLRPSFPGTINLGVYADWYRAGIQWSMFGQ